MVTAIAIVVLAAVIIGFVVYKIISAKADPMLAEAQEIETVTADLITVFYKRADVLEKLKNDKDLLPVAIKNKVNVKGMEKIHIIATLYNQKKGEVVEMNDRLNYVAAGMDRKLTEMFGDKDMIILK